MNSLRWPIGARRLGVALSPEALVVGSDAGSERIAIAPPAVDAWPALADALRCVRERLGGPPLALDVALLPPLTQTRAVALPPMRGADLARLVRREAATYFPINAATLVTAARGARVGDRTVAFVSAAEGRLLDAIHAATRDAGCSVRSIVAAESAWIAAAGDEVRRAPWRLLALLDDRIELLEVGGDAPTLVRRLPGFAVDAPRLAALLGEPGATEVPLRVVRAADAPPLDALFAVVDPGHSVPTALVGEASAEQLAARWAGAVGAPRLVTEAQRSNDARAERRRAGALAAAAMVLVLVGAAIGALATHRELARVEGWRAAIRPHVARALVTRESLARTTARLAEIDTARATSPRWSSVLASLARRLPDDAHLLAIRSDGDSITVEGVGASAATVLASVRGLDEARDVRASSPITQETGAGGALVERFVLTIVLQPWSAPAAPASVAMASNGTAGRRGMP